MSKKKDDEKLDYLLPFKLVYACLAIWWSMRREVKEPHYVLGKAKDGLLHQFPFNDIKEHEESMQCWCKPRITKGHFGKHVEHNVFSPDFGNSRDMN